MAPGWYRDPEDSLHWRYWNGSAWTNQRSPLEQQSSKEHSFKKSDASSDESSWAEQALRWWQRQGQNTQIGVGVGAVVFTFLPNTWKMAIMLGALIVFTVAVVVRP